MGKAAGVVRRIKPWVTTGGGALGTGVRTDPTYQRVAACEVERPASELSYVDSCFGFVGESLDLFGCDRASFVRDWLHWSSPRYGSRATKFGRAAMVSGPCMFARTARMGGPMITVVTPSRASTQAIGSRSRRCQARTRWGNDCTCGRDPQGGFGRIWPDPRRRRVEHALCEVEFDGGELACGSFLVGRCQSWRRPVSEVS